MKVTALEEYGLRCMLLLASLEENKSLSLQEISEKENLSLPYAGKLLMILRNSGLVRAVRGRNGGYILTRRPETISLKDVFSALGDNLYGSHHCERYSEKREDCVHSGNCRVGPLWNAFNNHIQAVLEKVTLADMAGGNGQYQELIRVN